MHTHKHERTASVRVMVKKREMSNVVCDEGQAWIVHVEPSRDLTVGDKEDLSNPRRMLHERPDRVAQLLIKNSKKNI